MDPEGFDEETQLKHLEQLIAKLRRKSRRLSKDDLDRGALKKIHGGFARIDKIFQGDLESILSDIKHSLYPQDEKYA